MVKKRKGHKTVKDIIETINENRIIFLHGEINAASANEVILKLLYLDGISDEDISLYINSPGGSVQDGLAIIDTMNFINSDVATIGIGLCASMAAIILASGAKDNRSALPHTDIMLHQVMGGFQGQASDIQIAAEKTKKVKNTLNKILTEVTGQSYKKIEKDTDRDFWLSSKEAIEYGIIDKVLEKKELVAS